MDQINQRAAMSVAGPATMVLVAASHTAQVSAQLLQIELSEPGEYLVSGGAQRSSDGQRCWLDFALTPRPPARAGYPARWGAPRNERIGELLLQPIGEQLRIRSDAGQWHTLRVGLDAALIARWFGDEPAWNDLQLEACLDIRDESMHCHMMRLVRELKHPDGGSDTALDAIGTLMTIELSRYCAVVAQSRVSSGLAPWRLRLIDERLQAAGKPPTLAELAQLCGLSVRQLSRGFSVSRGCSLGQYVEQGRIESAKQLLIAGRSIKEVAYAMGFASPSSFSYAFRRVSGMSPAQFRRFAYRPDSSPGAAQAAV